MRKTALLMLCAGLGVGTQARALPVNDSGYQGNAAYGAPAAGASDSAITRPRQTNGCTDGSAALRRMVEERRKP